MGTNPVNITVYFKKNVVRYHFDTQGGNAIANMEENTVASTTTPGTIPTPTTVMYLTDGLHIPIKTVIKNLMPEMLTVLHLQE